MKCKKIYGVGISEGESHLLANTVRSGTREKLHEGALDNKMYTFNVYSQTVRYL